MTSKDMTIEEALALAQVGMKKEADERPPINRRAILETYEDEWQLEARRPKNLKDLR